MRGPWRSWLGMAVCALTMATTACGDSNGGGAATDTAEDSGGTDASTADGDAGEGGAELPSTEEGGGDAIVDAGPDGAPLDGEGGEDDGGIDVVSDIADTTEERPRVYEATIRRTSYGVPHVVAPTWGDAGFGTGYAFAQDNVCLLADQILRANSKRARYFGAGTDKANINSDFAMLALRNRWWAEQSLESLREDVRELIQGYVAGYNYYLAVTGTGNLPEACKDAEWVQPITDIDYLAYLHMVSLYGSGTNLAKLIATAIPPGSTDVIDGLDETNLPDFRKLDFGSNGWGLGKDKTTSGNGMLVVNPHFPWEGERRFSELHLTIPGEYDVYGAALIGSPLPNIGFNANLGWTHTVSTAMHFTFYKITPVAGTPTSYKRGTKEVAMTGTTFEIEVLGEDQELTTLSRTLYRTEYGPMLNISPFGWTPGLAVSYRDANEGNMRTIAQWMDMGRASTLEEFQESLRTHQGIPWVNTMYADKAGNAFYADITPAPNLGAEAVADWESALKTDFFTQQAWNSGIILLDGTKPAHGWQDDASAPTEGIIGYEDAPKLVRTDYVCNANDSHWLTNAMAPLSGYPRVWGDEETPRSPRTRMNLQMITDVGAGADAGEDGTFTFEELQASILGHRGLLGELLVDSFVQACDGVPTVDVGDETVNIEAACEVLKAWDRRFSTESVGAVLWRETLQGLPYAAYTDAGALFETPWDSADPIGTPAGLSSQADPNTMLAKAVQKLEQAGFSPSAPLGEVQVRKVNGERIGVPGGYGVPDGVFNVISVSNGNNTLIPSTTIGTVVTPSTGFSNEGYVIRYGSSIMMITEFTPSGPKAVALLTYSQSSDPASEHYADQTELFSTSSWRPVLFTEDEITGDPAYSATTVTNEPIE